MWKAWPNTSAPTAAICKRQTALSGKNTRRSGRNDAWKGNKDATLRCHAPERQAGRGVPGMCPSLLPKRPILGGVWVQLGRLG
ncbi:hypothetical protein AZSI13_06530 [Azospira sp. I13]|nr:hypothetical protein AZSI13_06530 [Azospira sp. I13]